MSISLSDVFLPDNRKKLKTDNKIRLLNLVEWVNSNFNGVFSHAHVGQHMQVVACALQIQALHLWHVMLVFIYLCAHRLHLFLLSPLSLAVSDLAYRPQISLTNPAEAGIRGRRWRCWMWGTSMAFPNSSRNSLLLKNFPCFHPGFTSIHTMMCCKLTHLRCWQTPPLANVLSSSDKSMCQ